MRALSLAIDGMELPAIEKISESQQEDAFQVLIATLLSARTKDQTTLEASTRLFKRARTPRTLAKLPVKEVPTTLDEMVTLPGVGRKTANLVMILAYASQQNICVDTHVHRIANHLGWVKTKSPEETEQALYQDTEPRWWPYINLYLVTWGQNVCRPVYPRCGDCAIASLCPKIGVTRVGHSRVVSGPINPRL